jgi:hypothetical protein
MKKYVPLLIMVMFFIVFSGCVGQQKTVPSDSTAKVNIKDEPISSAVYTSPKIDKQSMVADDVYHPVIFAMRNIEGTISSAAVLGGSQDGKWYRIEDFEIRYHGKLVDDQNFEPQDNEKPYVSLELVNGGEIFSLYSESEFITKVVGSKPLLYISWSDGARIVPIEFKPFKIEDEYLIGVNGDWNVLPRRPLQVASGVSQIDLDCDGVDERIVSRAVYVSSEGFETPITEIEVKLEKKGKNIFNTKIQLDGTYVSDYKILTPDLNGDGKLELVIIEGGHNITVNVYEVKDKVKSVFHFYVGD